jgi:hypothetical protein
MKIFKRAISIPVLVGVLLPAGLAAFVAASLVGTQPDGSVLLPNGQVITPAGVQIEVNDRPLGIALSPDGSQAAVATASNFATRALHIIDLGARTVAQTLSIGNSFAGVAYSPDGNTLYVWSTDRQAPTSDRPLAFHSPGAAFRRAQVEAARHSGGLYAPADVWMYSGDLRPAEVSHPMPHVTRRAAAAAALAATCLSATACTNGSTTGNSSITLLDVPPAADGGAPQLAPIAGRVSGAQPGQRVVVFAKSGVWWVQPLVAQPFTEIAPDATWKNTTHLGTEYAALLVNADYQPPPTIESLPPAGGAIVAIATAKGSGRYTTPAQKVLKFSGYEWEVRQIPSDRAGANDYDARNAWVDEGGLLHLLLTERDGRWTSAEVKLTRSLGYGTYMFVVRDTSRLDPAAALGFLTWDELAREQNYRELDIEVSRWGTPENKDLQYVVQPHYVAANVYRFNQPAGPLTHSFRWEPDRAVFQTVRAGGAVVARREFTSGVPASGAESVRMNLLYYRRSAKPPSGNVEVVIEKFEYLP